MSAQVESMAYVEEYGVPWHGLGNPVEKNIDVREMLIRSGCAWEVRKIPLMMPQEPYKLDDDGQIVAGKSYRPLDDSYALVRSDTGAKLSTVGPVYEPIQNFQVFQFFDEYVKAGEAYIETAGSLKDGQVIWALAKMDESFRLGHSKSKDIVEGFILLANYHQYGKAAQVKFTPIRVVCNNTLTMSLQGGSDLRIWHNAEFDEPAQQQAKEQLGIAREQMAAFRDDAETLVELSLHRDDALALAVDLFNGDEDEDDVDEQPKDVRRVMSLYEGEAQGSHLKTADGTGWGFLNAVTQYFDWEKGRLQDRRLERSWLGTGERRKQETLESLLARAR